MDILIIIYFLFTLEKALFLMSNLVKHVKNEISKGNFVSILLLKSNSIISGQFKNKFIKSSEFSVIFLEE
jgi:hypothetical protein